MPSLNGGRGEGVAGMVKRPFTVTLNSSLTALLHLSDNVLVVKTIFYSLFLFFPFELKVDKPVFPPSILQLNTVNRRVINV